MEGEGKDFGKGTLFETVVARKRDDCVGRGEFGEDLAAGSTGRTGGGVEICNRDGDDFVGWTTLGDGAEECGALGADRQAVGDVFDVAAGRDESIVEEQGCADAEAGVGCIGVFGGFPSGRLELFSGVAGEGRRI